MTRRIMLVGPPGDPLVAGHARLLDRVGWTAVIANPQPGDRGPWPRDLRVIHHPADPGRVPMTPLERAGVAGRQGMATTSMGARNTSIRLEAKLWERPALRPAVRLIRKAWNDRQFMDSEAMVALANLGFQPMRDVPWLAGEMERRSVDLAISFDLHHAHVLTEATRQVASGRIAHVAVMTRSTELDRQTVSGAALLAADGLVPLRPEGLDWIQQQEYRGVYSMLPLLGVSADMDAIRACRAPGPASARRLLVLDGRQDAANRAFVSVHAVELAADALREAGADIAIVDPNDDVVLAARLVGIRTGLPIRMVTNAEGGHRLRLLGRARCLLIPAESGPTPPMLIEAMAAGAFPISSPQVASDWIVPGFNGALLPPNDPDAMAEALRAVMSLDDPVDRADANNAEALAPMLSWDAMVRPMLDLYGVALLRPGTS